MCVWVCLSVRWCVHVCGRGACVSDMPAAGIHTRIAYNELRRVIALYRIPARHAEHPDRDDVGIVSCNHLTWLHTSSRTVAHTLHTHARLCVHIVYKTTPQMPRTWRHRREIKTDRERERETRRVILYDWSRNSNSQPRCASSSSNCGSSNIAQHQNGATEPHMPGELYMTLLNLTYVYHVIYLYSIVSMHYI